MNEKLWNCNHGILMGKVEERFEKYLSQFKQNQHGK